MLRIYFMSPPTGGEQDLNYSTTWFPYRVILFLKPIVVVFRKIQSI